MFLDDPSDAQKEEFTFEIEQMKLLGSHKNIVSLVGWYTLKDQNFLVVEYVPFGDLLTWLRCRRKEVTKKRKLYSFKTELHGVTHVPWLLFFYRTPLWAYFSPVAVLNVEVCL